MKTSVRELLRSLKHRPQLGNSVVELLIFAAAGAGAFLLRFEFNIPVYYRTHLFAVLPVWMLVKLAAFHVAGLDRRFWKFFSVSDAVSLAGANAAGSAVTAALIAIGSPPGFPRSIVIIDFLLSTLGTSLVFLARRAVSEMVTRSRHTGGRKVLIYGAGRAGVALASEMRTNQHLGYEVLGFIDDNPAVVGMYIHGIPVLGSGTDLTAAARRSRVEEVLIAVPSATSQQMLAILTHCHEAGIRCRTMATLAEIVEGKTLSTQIRDVDVQDLLCRTPARLNHGQIREQVENRVVMITGAAGSIGSELCRQIARFHPQAIVGFDVAETALFYLEREMKEQFPDVIFHPEIGSIRDNGRLCAVLDRHRPGILYHAAAYKHVPMMERSIFEALRNNVFGTHTLAAAAEEYEVDRFVMISSDKAVRPTSVMGATKRLCELLLLSRQGRHTQYSAVRFGNVLGSNGSVIPLFKQQIAAGGPITVTHPDMRRYFMTIPEAAQLVIQASVMGKGGEIFVLDMGEQLKIVDLARNLILLSGLRPDTDIPIRFTGTRPGEKLYEELSLIDEETVPTHHPKIKIFTGSALAGGILTYIEDLEAACAEQDFRRALLLMKEIVPEYNPSSYLLRQLIGPTAEGDEAALPLTRAVPRLRSMARGA